MENRFGLKDFVLITLAIVTIVMLALAMKQYDRQWGELKTIRARVDAQAQDLRTLRDRLSSGTLMPTTTGGATTQPADASDPFAGIRTAQAMPGYAKGDWLVNVFGGQVAKLTPLLSGDAYASQVQGSVLESLATRDPETLGWKPLLSTGWTITDNTKEWTEYATKRKAVPLTPDEVRKDAAFPKDAPPAEQQVYVDQRVKVGRTNADIAAEPETPTAIAIRFTMRPGLRFSDGQPLTADDVLFTYNFVMNPAIAAPRDRAYLERIKAVNKVGNDEVEFVFKEPYFEAFEVAASIQVMPKHFYDRFGAEEFNQSVGLLLGSGPYRMEDPASWKPGTPIQLVRNENYWGVAPAFNRLVYKEISSDKGRLASFRNGEVDMFGATPEQYRELIKDEGLMKRVQRFEYQNPIGGYRYVAWNQKNPLFADKRARQALTMLMDRQRMINEIMLGYAVQATGPFNPLSKQYSPNVQPWKYDVDAAKTQLAAVGFADRNGDGVIELPDGKPFEFKLTYPGGGGNYERMVLFIKDAYARAGIVVKPDPLEWGVFTDRLANKNFEAISLGWTSGIEGDIFQMFHSSQAGPGGDNFMSYVSPKLDALIDQARTTVDEATRMPLWHQAHEVIHEDQPYTFLWFGKSLTFVDNRIENVKRVKLGLNPSDEWFVPADRQRYTQ